MITYPQILSSVLLIVACSPKVLTFKYNKRELIYHWIAQRYINFNEDDTSFMHLLRMGFFQEEEEDEFGAIKSCKMHDINHDLALYLIGEEGEFGTSSNVSSSTRHVSLIVDGDEGVSWDVPSSLLNVKSIRSCMLRRLLPIQPDLHQLCSNFKLLHTLTLSDLGIKHIPPSIGELKLVKYLDLSRNDFEELPGSITNMVNLLVLNLEGCGNMKVWPCNFKNLKKLRFLKLEQISSMPEGIAGMDNLQYLSSFRVENWSKVDGLNKLLEQVRGDLFIMFDIDMEVEVEHEGRWQLPTIISLQDIKISSYPGHEIEGWGDNEGEIKLERLQLENCVNVKYLPSMSHLPVLKFLCLKNLPELEFIEEEEEVNTHNPTTLQKFFPCLKKLELKDLPKLKGWHGKLASEATSTSLKSGFPSKAFASLEHLVIVGCSSLTSLHLPLPHLLIIDIERCFGLMTIELDQSESLHSLKISDCTNLKSLHIEELVLEGMEEIEIKSCPNLKFGLFNTQDQRLLENSPSLLSMTSLEMISITGCEWALRSLQLPCIVDCFLKDINGLQSLHVPSPHLRDIDLLNCMGLTSVELGVPFCITIESCSELKNFRIADPVAVQVLYIDSPSWVDWGSISNLSECSCLTRLTLGGVDGRFIEQFSRASSSSSIVKGIGSVTVALTYLKDFTIGCVDGLKSLIIKSPHLHCIDIANCNELTSVEIDSPLIAYPTRTTAYPIVNISSCSQLKNVRIPRPISPQTLAIVECPELSLNTGVDWEALTDLRNLRLYPLPPPEELPQCLLQRQDLGRLCIIEAKGFWAIDSDLDFDSDSDSDSDTEI